MVIKQFTFILIATNNYKMYVNIKIILTKYSEIRGKTPSDCNMKRGTSMLFYNN